MFIAIKAWVLWTCNDLTTLPLGITSFYDLTIRYNIVLKSISMVTVFTILDFTEMTLKKSLMVEYIDKTNCGIYTSLWNYSLIHNQPGTSHKLNKHKRSSHLAAVDAVTILVPIHPCQVSTTDLEVGYLLSKATGDRSAKLVSVTCITSWPCTRGV